jgi:hypothetical protein
MCGGLTKEGDEFCPSCGTKLSPSTFGQAATPPQSPPPSILAGSTRTFKKRGYSKKTRLLGVASIAVLILAVAVSALGWYSIGASVLQTGTALSSRAQNGTSGSGLIENTSSGEALVLPITDGGVFPISVSISGALLDSQNVSLLSIDSTATINPHQTYSMVVPIATSAYKQLLAENSTTVSVATLRGRVEVTTLDGLLGARLSLSLNLTSSIGTSGGLLA